MMIEIGMIVEDRINSKRVVRPLSGRCDFESVFRVLIILKISLPKIFMTPKFNFLSND